jgi:DNA repair exonuclease SbcCD ATPase subunit
LVKQIEDLNQEVKRLNTQFANGIGAQVCELYGKIGGLDSQLVDIKKEENQALASKPNLLEAEQMIARAREKIKAITKEDQEKNAKRIEVTNTRRKALKIIDERLFNIKRANETLKEKSVQFELVGQSTCPTCTRVWDNEESRTKLQKLELECNELKMLVGTESGLLLERDSVLLELDDLAKIIKNPDIDKWIEAERKCSDSLKSIMAKHSEEIGVVIAGLSDKKKDLVEKKAVLVQTINALKNSSSSEADRLSDQIAEKERELTALRQSLLVLQNTTLQYDKDMQNYDRQLSAVKQQETALAALQNDLATATTQLNMERDFVDMVGRNGFLGLIFDEVLAEIATEANSRLAKLANVSGVTIRFDSEVTTQAGTTKRSITPVISIGGHEAKLNSGLSGGMLTSVEQVVDLAVMEVVQRRTGNIPGWLILDEAFNGQGMATKESCMEVLGEYAKDKTILVIDHASEFKEMFTQFIDVESFNGFSTIK